MPGIHLLRYFIITQKFPVTKLSVVITFISTTMLRMKKIFFLIWKSYQSTVYKTQYPVCRQISYMKQFFSIILKIQ